MQGKNIDNNIYISYFVSFRIYVHECLVVSSVKMQMDI
jgi:hypothetical protein